MVGFHGGKKTDTKQIEELEGMLGVTFPESYRQFIQENDGVRLSPNVVSFGDVECGVSEFIPIREIVDDLETLNWDGPFVVPFAWGDGGNRFAFDVENGYCVVFLDHEIANKKAKVSSSFESFFDKILPWNDDEVALGEYEVLSTWVDPSFVPEFDD